jgi:hypothetical protein
MIVVTLDNEESHQSRLEKGTLRSVRGIIEVEAKERKGELQRGYGTKKMVRSLRVWDDKCRRFEKIWYKT